MYSKEDILECAYAIRPSLPELLGDEAPAVDQALADLLTRATNGEKTDTLILELLSQRQTTKEWARYYLEPLPVERGSTSPPGSLSPIAVSGSRYYCPRCGFRWIRREAGQTIPEFCPRDNMTHLQPVVAVSRRHNAE